ncbi:Uncharacterised protein [Segatella copri]|nr:Uncharacterised protein [Segatella copri]
MATLSGAGSPSLTALVSKYSFVVIICKLFASRIVQKCAKMCKNVQDST